MPTKPIVTARPPGSASSHVNISPGERERLARAADADRLPRAFGRPLVRGAIRSEAEDFVVDEQLSFVLSGEGEHLYLHVRKSGQNTRWVAKQLARRCGVAPRAVGYAGLKDRHAVASQWFSVHLPGMPDPDVNALEIEGVEVIECVRHNAKLRTGALSGNRFRLLIRELAGDRDALAARLATFGKQVIPNFFGAQRFGHGGGNLDLLTGSDLRLSREARSFGLSALRSALFNAWLAGRIDDDSWRCTLDGEIGFRRAEGRFVHTSKVETDELVEPTGLLWGCGDNQSTGVALARESAFIGGFADTRDLLVQHDVRMLRRSLWAHPVDFSFDLRGDALELRFTLARGQFATAVIRELGEFFDAA
ncbi:MAG: tRNA pseudouridine(13) synthase TruD [Gammaproteobacteria bacterium]